MNNTTDRDFDLTINDRVIPGRVPLHMRLRFLVSDSIVDCPEQEAAPRLFAVIGMCWAGDDLGVPTLRSLGYDLTEYGDFVHDRLHEMGLTAPPDGAYDWRPHYKKCKKCKADKPGCAKGRKLYAAHFTTAISQGLRARELVIASIPTPSEVEAAADFIEVPGEISTTSM